MLGTWRFVLALAVFAFHLPGARDDHFAVGIAAVLCFFFISGFLMSTSFSRFAANSSTLSGAVRGFCGDRFLKIFPVYWITLALTYAATVGFGGSEYINWAWVRVPDTFWSVIRNIAAFPLNYSFAPYYLGPVENPPTWSLGAELQFYVLVPVIWLAFRRGFDRTVAVCMIASFLFLLFNLTYSKSVIWNGWLILHEDYGAYRPIWTLIAIFTAGFMYEQVRSGTDRGPAKAALIAGYVACAGFALWQLTFGEVLARSVPWTIVFAILICLPVSAVILYTMAYAGPAKWRSLDSKMGKLSYPFFLTHMPALLIAEHLLGFGPRGLSEPVLYWTYVATAGVLGILIAVPVAAAAGGIDRLRIGMRGFASLQASTATMSGGAIRATPARHMPRCSRSA